MKKRIFILGLFSYFVNISFLASGNDEQEIPKYKLIFLGDAMVGKSCIIGRFVKGTFTKEYDATVGLDFQSKIVKIDEQDDQKIKFLLYDTAGQEKFRSIIPMYTRNADIILLVYDVTSKDSFTHISNWFKDLTNINKEDVIFVVVGNKIDLGNKIDFIDTRQVSTEEGKKFAEENGFIFKEVSAATGDGINELFDVILKEMLKKKLESQPLLSQMINFGGEIKTEVGKKDCCCCC